MTNSIGPIQGHSFSFIEKLKNIPRNIQKSSLQTKVIAAASVISALALALYANTSRREGLGLVPFMDTETMPTEVLPAAEKLTTVAAPNSRLWQLLAVPVGTLLVQVTQIALLFGRLPGLPRVLIPSHKLYPILKGENREVWAPLKSTVKNRMSPIQQLHIPQKIILNKRAHRVS